MADRRERKKLETRAALLESALALVKMRGIYGTRVEDITERADVGKGVFYNYFDSKDAVIAALLSDGVDLLQRDYLRAMPPEAGIVARIENVVMSHDRFFSEHPEYSLLFHQARGVLQLGQDGIQELRAVFSRYLRSIAAALDPSASETRAPSDAHLEASVMLAGAISGYRSYSLASGRSGDAASIVAALAGGVPLMIERLAVPAAEALRALG